VASRTSNDPRLFGRAIAGPLIGSLLGRLPFSALGVLLILRTRELGGTYVEGAYVVAAFTTGLAIGAPIVGRLVDRRGQTAVLAACLFPATLPLLGMGVFGLGLPLLMAAALLSGLTQPPLSGSVRALWPVLVADEDRRHRLMTFEVTAVEGAFLVGPLLFVGGIAAAASAGLAIVAAAALIILGTALLVSSQASRQWRPAARGRPHLLGALTNRGIRMVMVGVACTGASFSAIEIGTTAFAESHGDPYLVAPLLTVWGASILTGGLVAARRPKPRRPERFVVVTFASTGLADLALGLARDPVTLGALFVIAGLVVTPTLATLYGIVNAVSDTDRVTESHTWLVTAMATGTALGSLVAGVAVEHRSPSAGLMVSGAAMLLAALVMARRQPALRARS
jgi:MFS family permease